MKRWTGKTRKVRREKGAEDVKTFNANKSKLYYLVELYSPFPLPEISCVDYMETHRCAGCGICYDSMCGRVKAFLRVFLGKTELSVECEEQGYDRIFHPDEEILNLYGICVPDSGTQRGWH